MDLFLARHLSWDNLGETALYFSKRYRWQRIKRGQQLLITKNGANMGFSTFIGFSPSKQFGVVVLTNKATVKESETKN